MSMIEMTEFRCDHFQNIHAPLTTRGRKYEMFDCLSGRVGVYLFHEQESGCVLYVGSSVGGKDGWDIVSRLKQHYRKGSSTSFFDNWALFHEHDRDIGSAFVEFLQGYERWSITTLTIPVLGANEDDITDLENHLTIRLRPKYIRKFFPESVGNIANLPAALSIGGER